MSIFDRDYRGNKSRNCDSLPLPEFRSPYMGPVPAHLVLDIEEPEEEIDYTLKNGLPYSGWD